MILLTCLINRSIISIYFEYFVYIDNGFDWECGAMKLNVVFLLLSALISAFGSTSSGIKYDGLTELIKSPPESVCLIDLRSEKDFGLAHLENFVSQPWENGEEQLLMMAEDYGKNTEFYFLCYSGKRSKEAETLLKENGYNARALPFGYEEYIAACGDYYAHGAAICEPCKEMEEE